MCTNLTKTCVFRVSVKEKEDINKKAESNNLKPSEYLRKKVLEPNMNTINDLLDLRELYIKQNIDITFLNKVIADLLNLQK
ncbi:plasmid mobilization protein [Clostridium botulinum]|uniref:plasmid mobilization protein n=1 Tax=Clostridium botulinum TaxID=1491 RepID=UPI000773E6F3|nr:hypothetical protein [Clostridium botulinum]NFL40092.1 hypothetical protein [Clostridium botulinum]NFL67171.1 hypothetical protein [Clostridium botulinum]NFN09967.1 hypothetical protein [Clostridium botulinum]NFN33494.1 hypothetical protein [Clostridium botulinum]